MIRLFTWLPMMLGLFGAGCRTGSTVEMPGNVTYAVAATAGARFRADAGCFALCTGGTVCDHATGYCCEPGTRECRDANSCGLRCGVDQYCDNGGLVPHCVSVNARSDAGTSTVPQ